tara:strand:+ start:300 stop:656 length:357 start_codon:yes stop_codon:yes gene_type:complete
MPDESFLKTFADAWNNRDIDAIMNHMAEDGVFISSSEEKFVGAAVVRQAFAAVFEAFPDVRFNEDRHFVSGDHGLSEWVFTGTDAEDGTAVEMKGCDISTFRDGKIVVKDSYLKQQGG